MEITLANDFTAFSFWVATAVMFMGAAFFFMERSTVNKEWQTSLTVACLVCLVAFWHYLYMRTGYMASGESPTELRYVDWLITVPLQIVEFYLIVAAVTAVSLGLFWKLLFGSLVMLVGGYMGEAGMVSEMTGFIVGMVGWVYVIWLIWAGGSDQPVGPGAQLVGSCDSCSSPSRPGFHRWHADSTGASL